MKTFLNHFLTNETPTYGNRTGDISILKNTSIEEGASCNSLKITMSNHVGTHIDLPAHFDCKGKRVKDYSADEWFFKKIQLIDIKKNQGEFISFQEMAKYLNPSTEVLLIRTGFEAYRNNDCYWQENPGLLEDVGQELRINYPDLKVLGFDFISVSSYTNRPLGRKAHQSLLSSEFPGSPLRVIEDMKLGHLKSNPLSIMIAPLPIELADGIQVTVIADI